MDQSGGQKQIKNYVAYKMLVFDMEGDRFSFRAAGVGRGGGESVEKVKRKQTAF